MYREVGVAAEMSGAVVVKVQTAGLLAGVGRMLDSQAAEATICVEGGGAATVVATRLSLTQVS